MANPEPKCHWSNLSRQSEQVRGKWFTRSWPVIVTVWFLSIPSALAIGIGPVTTAKLTLTLIDRTVTQDQGTWVIDYRLRHAGQNGIIIAPEEIAVKVEGWVSNSRVASHTIPRWSSLTLAQGAEVPAVADVITASNELHKCRERLLVSVWTEDQSLPKHKSTQPPSCREKTGSPAFPFSELGTPLSLSLSPSTIVHLRLRIEHQHLIYGEYDPLLAVRSITLALGSAPVRDILPLDREQYLAQPQFTWPDPPSDRRDARHAVSGPDSLHLEADIPGHQYYRYPERPVRYSTKMRLRFWYLIAVGTEGECSVRLTQFMDTPISWRPLHNGRYEECLKTIGRWTKVERIIQTEPEATTVTVEFKIFGDTEVGEMWIDGVSLEPMVSTFAAGP
jgi:hypothetical protein